MEEVIKFGEDMDHKLVTKKYRISSSPIFSRPLGEITI